MPVQTRSQRHAVSSGVPNDFVALITQPLSRKRTRLRSAASETKRRPLKCVKLQPASLPMISFIDMNFTMGKSDMLVSVKRFFDKFNISVDRCYLGKAKMDGNCMYQSVLMAAGINASSVAGLIPLLRAIAVCKILRKVLEEDGFSQCVLLTVSDMSIGKYLLGQLQHTSAHSSDRYCSNIELHQLGEALNLRIIVFCEPGSRETGGIFGSDAADCGSVALLNTRRQHTSPILIEPRPIRALINPLTLYTLAEEAGETIVDSVLNESPVVVKHRTNCTKEELLKVAKKAQEVIRSAKK